MTISKTEAWGIEILPVYRLKEDKKWEKPYLVGRYGGGNMNIPTNFGGYRIAVFDTKREAEVVAKEYKKYTIRGSRKDCLFYNYVRVVKVQVTVRSAA